MIFQFVFQKKIRTSLKTIRILFFIYLLNTFEYILFEFILNLIHFFLILTYSGKLD